MKVIECEYCGVYTNPEGLEVYLCPCCGAPLKDFTVAKVDSKDRIFERQGMYSPTITASGVFMPVYEIGKAGPEYIKL